MSTETDPVVEARLAGALADAYLRGWGDRHAQRHGLSLATPDVIPHDLAPSGQTTRTKEIDPFGRASQRKAAP